MQYLNIKLIFCFIGSNKIKEGTVKKSKAQRGLNKIKEDSLEELSDSFEF